MTNHEIAERDYMLGMAYKDIASKYGVTLDTVKKWKQRYKWDRTGTKKTVHKTKRRQTKKVDNLPIVSDVGLTERQQLFCLYYVKNFNATQAALRAGYTENYPSETGYQLLQKPTVRAEIERLKQIRRQSIMITEDDIIERYMRIAFADMTDFADFGVEEYPAVDESGQVLLDDKGNIKMRKRDYLDFKSSGQVDGGLICEISLGRNGMKVKLEDRQKALTFLADYFCMNPKDRHKIAYDNAVLNLRERELKAKEW